MYIKDLMPVCPFLYTIRNPGSMQSSSQLVLGLQEGSYGSHNLMCPGRQGMWPQPKPVWRDGVLLPSAGGGYVA